MAGENDKSSTAQIDGNSSTAVNSGSGVSGVVQYARRVNEQSYPFNGWKITVLKSPILPSVCYCNILDENNSKELLLELGCNFDEVNLPGTDSGNPTLPPLKCHVCRYSEEISLKHLPDMVFPDNCLHLHHEATGLVLEFNTLDAIKTISTQDTESIQVACSEDWQASKNEMGLPNTEVLHDYNWTFATDYQGTVRRHLQRSNPEVNIIKNPPEQLNIEKLKQKEPILFYDELTLFEDELHDNGTSNLSVKLRVMPSGFFILLRHILRVDHVMIRICDTRIHYEIKNNYVLRQFQMKQQSFKHLGNFDPHQFADINALSQHLPIVKEVTDKIMIQ